MTKSTHFIAFSYNRPLQLHGYLSSLFRHVSGPVNVDVLYRVEDQIYDDAYVLVKKHFPGVKFFKETDFAAQMANLFQTDDSEYVCFGCDDVVFQQPVDLSEVDVLLSNQDIIGTSLRLGRNIIMGMFGAPQEQPHTTKAYGDFIMWDMVSASGDWAYPFDVLGTIYRREFVEALWPALATAVNPSTFEDAGSKNWFHVSNQRYYSSWDTSRTVVPTPNVVQDVFGNGFVGREPLSPDFLLACWLAGMRLDIDRFEMSEYPGWRIADFYLKRET